jgi:hypothetical protein
MQSVTERRERPEREGGPGKGKGCKSRKKRKLGKKKRGWVFLTIISREGACKLGVEFPATFSFVLFFSVKEVKRMCNSSIWVRSC